MLKRSNVTDWLSILGFCFGSLLEFLSLILNQKLHNVFCNFYVTMKIKETILTTHKLHLIFRRTASWYWEKFSLKHIYRVTAISNLAKSFSLTILIPTDYTHQFSTAASSNFVLYFTICSKLVIKERKVASFASFRLHFPSSMKLFLFWIVAGNSG